MAGGIYINQPFSPNIKCIIYGFWMMSVYWFMPCEKNVYLLPAIFIMSYIGMSWYDYKYECTNKLYTGSQGIIGVLDSPFKPQRRDEEPERIRNPERILDPEPGIELLPNQEQEYLKRVYAFHVILVAPLLIYLGIKGKESNEKIFGLVLILGVLALTYHGMRFLYPR